MFALVNRYSSTAVIFTVKLLYSLLANSTTVTSTVKFKYLHFTPVGCYPATKLYYFKIPRQLIYSQIPLVANSCIPY